MSLNLTRWTFKLRFVQNFRACYLPVGCIIISSVQTLLWAAMEYFRASRAHPLTHPWPYRPSAKVQLARLMHMTSAMLQLLLTWQLQVSANEREKPENSQKIISYYIYFQRDWELRAIILIAHCCTHNDKKLQGIHGTIGSPTHYCSRV